MKIIIYCEANSERQYYKAICDQLNVGATVVSNTDQFKDELNSVSFQLILLSLHLVDIHSFELANYIRAQKKYLSTPIVVMTANDRSLILQDALNAKISDVCEKRNIANLTSIIKKMSTRFKQIDARVLYVEDSKSIAALTIQTLQQTGIEVDWCCDIRHAQELALQNQYDLLLLDTVLNNNESGIDFLIWLRVNASQQNQTIPVLVVSSFDAADRKIQIFNAGADDFLSKPYIEDELLTRIIGLIERKQNASSEIKASDPKLEQKRTRFLATITHDLRAPLNAVLGNLQILQSSKLDVIQTSNVKQAISAGNMLNDLIRDLLEFSTLEDSQFTLYPKSNDLHEICEEVFNTIDVALNKESIQFNMTIDDALPKTVMLDALRLKQVLLNLLSNAAKFTSEGKIEFIVEYQSAENQAIFHIKDTGKGIAQEDLDSVFDTFSQSDRESVEANEGVGLGLSICNRLVALFGGKLEVQSQADIGSHFYFTMPLTLNDEKEVESPKVDAFPKDNEYLVLVVDDNEFNLEIMRSFLNRINIECKTATNGLQGLKLLEKHDFDSVILDCQMPIMDGFTMATEMRYDPKYNEIAIIASSGSYTKQDKQLCIESGMDYFLPKPVVFDDIKQVLEQSFKRTSL